MYSNLSDLSLLSSEEYLQLLIDLYFSQYKDKKIFLSIYNNRREKKFTSDLAQVIFNCPDSQCLNKSLSEQPLLKKFPQLFIINKIFDLIIETNQGYSFIIFDKYDGKFGALHTRIDPIFHNSTICGFVSKSYNYTKLIFGIDKFYIAQQSESEKVKITAKDLEILTSKQRKILFLLAIDYTQEQISKHLEVSRGTIVKTIATISQKLNLKTVSAGYLMKAINRSSILSKLPLPDIEFDPIIIIIEHDLESHFSVNKL